ncbi:MAG: asparagine synthase C-terminal domain-containing protein [Methanomassiliicoccaceae archaeon]|nr:asparagine synthase C-terminal domain-containing protein [Methanomassiliicoccaceae archaeon]
MLINSVKAEDLVGELTRCLDAPIRKEVLGKRVAIAFSGGLDCGIVAVLCKKYADVTLYTAGTENSYDAKAGEETASILGLPWRHLIISEEGLEKEIPEMIRITGTVNPITLSFEVPLYYVLKFSEEDVVLGGQGADELFAGYSKYIGLSKDSFTDMVKDDMARLLDETLEHERAAASHFGKKMIYPYLDAGVVDLVNRIGICGVSEGEVRKPLLRQAARSLGQPELAERPKKAAQYGSGTMPAMRSIAKKRNMSVREMITDMARDVL